MDKLRIKNLRSLADSGVIDFKNINIFVGQNSSGKSTCIRSLPLLKQSAQVKTISDLLWYGPFVDFGSFQESLCSASKSSFIEFHISMHVRVRRLKYRPLFSLRQGRSQIIPLTLVLKIGTDAKKPDADRLTTNYELHLYKSSISFSLNSELKLQSFQCGNQDLTGLAAKEYSFFRRFGILPGITLESDFSDDDNPFDEQIAKLLRNYVHGRKSTIDIVRTVGRLNIGSINDVLNQLKKLDLGSYWSTRAESWTTTTPETINIHNLLLARDFSQVFDAVGDHITEASNNIQYITPLRATAERYYRIQGLSVDEIDPQGRNLAMFLQTLNNEDANSFAEWTGKTMGFEARALTSKGHASIVLNEPGETERVNLADTGFGYSQVLPILAQLWQSSAKHTNTSSIPRYIAIEQPELHLHPRMQAQLAELFVAIASPQKNPDTNLKLVIETHSEAIINQLGKAVERGDVSPSDVAIFIFEKTSLTGTTRVREAKFDEEGYLTDWPYGFFDAS